MRGAANPYHKIPMDRREAQPGERIFIIKVIQSNREGKVRGHPYRIFAIPERITLFISSCGEQQIPITRSRWTGARRN